MANTLRSDPAFLALADKALSNDRRVATAASARLFKEVVEPLNDSFRRSDRNTYYRLFLQILGRLRGKPEAEPFNRALLSFGIASTGDLKHALAQRRKGLSRKALRPKPAHIFILSRVTLGADVAVTSRFIQHSLHACPNAAIHVLGGTRLKELFGGNRCLNFSRLNYPRRGPLIERLQAWVQACSLIRKRARNDTYIVLDPDSRITQLGILPLAEGQSTHLLFEGTARSRKDPRSLARHAQEWLDSTLGRLKKAHGTGRSRVWLRKKDLRIARQCLSRFGLHPGRTITVSFGTGGNDAKRMKGSFERLLVTRLIREGYTVVLDSGVDNEEIERAGRAIRACRSSGIPVASLDDSGGHRGADRFIEPGLITWKGGIGAFAAMISRSFWYMGYDSLFQHVAAALAVPQTVVFTGYRHPLFPVRWEPAGPGVINAFLVPEGVVAQPSELTQLMVAEIGEAIKK
ncbi:glycosyltransferase family 9 protein [Acidobacteriota bacterium]